MIPSRPPLNDATPTTVRPEEPRAVGGVSKGAYLLDFGDRKGMRRRPSRDTSAQSS
jgi:hypothetical protein